MNQDDTTQRCNVDPRTLSACNPSLIEGKCKERIATNNNPPWPKLIGFFAQFHSWRLNCLLLVVMKKRHLTTKVFLTLSTAFALLSQHTHAQTANQFQDAARPFGIDTVADVMQAASDDASADFQANDLPVLLDFVNTNLSERQALSDISGVALDPNALLLDTEASVRVYFVSEGAGYRNTLGYTSEDVVTGDTSSQLLIFPDASSHNRYFSDGVDISNNSVPLAPGDFVDLGTYPQDTLIDFFLIANGANRGSNTYTANAATNPDGIQHVVAYAVPGGPYLLIGFEDLYGGGDMDYNDIVFAVDIGESNVQNLAAIAAPEPSTWTLMAVTLGFAGWSYRRGQRRTDGPQAT